MANTKLIPYKATSNSGSSLHRSPAVCFERQSFISALRYLYNFMHIPNTQLTLRQTQV